MKICNQLVKNVKNYGFPDRTQGGQIWFLQETKSILEKGQKRAKGPNQNFGATKCCFGPNFWNLAPKGSIWQPWLQIHLCLFSHSIKMCGLPLSPASHCLAALLATMSAFNSSAVTGFSTKITRSTKKITRSETNSLDLNFFGKFVVLLEMI